MITVCGLQRKLLYSENTKHCTINQLKYYVKVRLQILKPDFSISYSKIDLQTTKIHFRLHSLYAASMLQFLCLPKNWTVLDEIYKKQQSLSAPGKTKTSQISPCISLFIHLFCQIQLVRSSTNFVETQYATGLCQFGALSKKIWLSLPVYDNLRNYNSLETNFSDSRSRRSTSQEISRRGLVDFSLHMSTSYFLLYYTYKSVKRMTQIAIFRLTSLLLNRVHFYLIDVIKTSTGKVLKLFFSRHQYIIRK